MQKLNIPEIDLSVLLAAIAEQKKKVMDNINDRKTDRKKKRSIVITIEFSPNPDSGTVAVGAYITSKLAPTAFMEMSEAVTQISFDDYDEDTGVYA